MKNKITCLLAGAALFGATANAEIVLGDSLSAYGYIDMALTDGEGDGNTEFNDVAEFELGLSFAPAESKWSAVAELSFDSGTDITSTSTSATAVAQDPVVEGVPGLSATTGGQVTGAETATTTASNATDSSAEFEVVTISYQYSDALSFSVGQMDTYQGFETADATGLYQFSYAGSSTVNDGYMYSALYAVGVSADYSSGDIDLGVWAGDTDTGTSSFEYYAGYNGVENLSLNVVYADDPGYETVNVWATYDYGDFTFAVESVDTENATGGDVLDLTTAMVYYSMGNGGITLRMTDGDYNGVDFDKFTVSPSYAFSDNVFGLVEFSSEELGEADDEDSLAVELIYSF
ncbi:MAG: hypothetical protein ACJ0BK_04155 [Coraliomargaritaceae bacterium]